MSFWGVMSKLNAGWARGRLAQTHCLDKARPNFNKG